MELDFNKKKDISDEYLKVNETMLNGAQAQGAGIQERPQQDYSQLAKDQEYGLLFDREIQLENAKANAQKYTMNQLGAQGFGSTGYGSSINSGIYNTYLSKLGEAQGDYSKAVGSADDDRFKSITTMLTQAGSVEQMDELLGHYGYMQDGKWLDKKPEGISADDWYQMQYYYNLQKDAIGNGDSSRPVYDYANESEIVYYDKDGVRHTNGGKTWNEENKTLLGGIKSGEIPSGSYVALVNGSKSVIYVYYSNGKTYYVNNEEFAKNQDKAYIIEGRDRTIKKFQ